MNWKEATRAQLYEIAFHDNGCNPRYKIEALFEIQRRNRKQGIGANPIERQYAKRQTV